MKHFEEIYHLHVDLVYNLSLQYVQNPEDAKEITQDVFLKVHDKLSKFENRSSLKTWIYRLTINVCLDFLKAKKAKKRRFESHKMNLDDPTVFSQLKEFNHPGVQIEQEEAIKEIFKAIDLLNENQRTALILLKIEGLSQAEVGEIMKLSSGAVESLFQRAKKNLKEIITIAKDNEE